MEVVDSVMVMDDLFMDAVTFSQNSDVVSCDLSLAKLRLWSGGGGGCFESFSCIRNLHLSTRWSESNMFSVTPASVTMHSLSLFVMMWSNWWGDFEHGCIHVPWDFFWKKVVAVVRPLLNRKECILLPESLVCGISKGPHTFPSFLPMLEFPSVPASNMLFVLHSLRAAL